MNIIERFIQYTKIDTSSIPQAKTLPSSEGQFKLAELLRAEMQALGMKNIVLRDNAILTGRLPSNTQRPCPTVVFSAHLDTSSECSGETRARVVQYAGDDIVLNDEQSIVLRKEDFPELDRYLHQDIIVTDGISLLGADNKSAIAGILDALTRLKEEDIEHGDIEVLFLPDEELCLLGAKSFDVSEVEADFGYNFDCGPIGRLAYQTWNACTCHIKCRGKAFHSGAAKNRMINSILIAQEFIGQLPAAERPENTEKEEGFFYVRNIDGSTATTKITVEVRDFYLASYEERKQKIYEIAHTINKRYGEEIVEVLINECYANVYDSIKKKGMYAVNLVQKVLEKLNIKIEYVMMRGGYDGAILSQKGLPMPNLFSGGHNAHSVYEFLPVESLKMLSNTIVEIARSIVSDHS